VEVKLRSEFLRRRQISDAKVLQLIQQINENFRRRVSVVAGAVTVFDVD
jgi:hypothetical protein